MEEKGRVGMSSTDVGTKTGNKEKRKASNYIVDQLRSDTGLSTEDLEKAMENREIWMILVNDVRRSSK